MQSETFETRGQARQLAGEDRYSKLLDEFLGNLSWRVIYASMDSVMFDGSLESLSQESGASLDQVLRALEVLQELGYVEKRDGLYKQLSNQMIVSEPEFFSKQASLSRHKSVSRMVLNEMGASKSHGSRFSVFRCKEENLQGLVEEIKALLLKYDRLSSMDPNCNKTYAFTFSATEVGASADKEV